MICKEEAEVEDSLSTIPSDEKQPDFASLLRPTPEKIKKIEKMEGKDRLPSLQT